MMSSQNLALDVTALSAGYGRFDVVHDIALKVGAGEAVALLGPNGAGKTTVLKAIMGLVSRATSRLMTETSRGARLRGDRTRGPAPFSRSDGRG